MTSERDRLVDSDTGRWEVLTETSRYELDLDRRTGRRSPGAGLPSGEEGYVLNALPHDEQEWDLLDIVLCEVGLSMLLVSASPSTLRPTTRASTPVRAIRALDR